MIICKPKIFKCKFFHRFHTKNNYLTIKRDQSQDGLLVLLVLIANFYECLSNSRDQKIKHIPLTSLHSQGIMLSCISFVIKHAHGVY